MTPTEQIAKPAILPKTGPFATLGAPLCTQGTGATLPSSITTPLITLCVFVALLALSSGVARAEVPKLVPNGQFTTEAGLGVAVDQSSGDVFVTGFIGKEFTLGLDQKFDASGKLLSPPSPFGEPVNYGAAVNPTDGDLYVATLSGSIDTYDPNTGELLSSFPVPAFWTGGLALEPYENTAQIAADSAGDVYVPNVPGNEVLEYSPTPTVVGGVAVPLQTFTGSGAHALSGPTGVAVDSSGDVWVADDRNNRVEEFGPTGVFLSEFKSEGVRSVALYEHEGAVDVLAIVYNSADSCGALAPSCAHLVEYGSGGAQLVDVAAGELGATFFPVSLSMVAVNEASGRVYVTDSLKGRVLVFRPPLAPVLGQESAVEVGTVEAKLGALVSPGGAQTTYRFEYDTREYAAGEGPHGVSVPFPEGSAGPGFSARAVWAAAKGLAPGTTYHYRAVATNGVGTAVGPDRTFTTETAAQGGCPNEQLRAGFSAALPDCRAYEAVVPPNIASAQPLTRHDIGGVAAGLFYRAADDGNRFMWTSAEVLPGSQSAQGEYIATRGAGGWSSEVSVPLQSYNYDRCTEDGAGSVAFSPDLSQALIADNRYRGGEVCRGSEMEEVVPGETQGVVNLLLRDNTDGAYRLLDVPPPGVEATNAGLTAFSADLNLVIFSNGAALTPEAPQGGEFEWSEGVVRPLKLALPSGAPVAGSVVHISPDGSELFFTAGGNLYVRVSRERTAQVDQARGGSGPGGGGSFAGLTADGSQVFFTDDASAGLTSDTVPGSGSNLYRYDVGTGRLSDLTPAAHAEAGFEGIGEDGAYVYFTATAVMSGSQANQFGETAASGQSNLYLSHGGTLVFVKRGGGVTLSPNGAYLAFSSPSSLTSYENQGTPELYLYSAASNRFDCATCHPDGEAPTGGGVQEFYIWEHESLPIPHPVSNNGQVFFQTAEALLPRDTNGRPDVYEYDFASGLHLISTGTSSSESRLLGSSVSGDDVFFLGRQALLPGESNEESLAIFDARVDGGFPGTTVPVCTTADACRAAPAQQPSIFGEPASQTFSGAGNLAPPEAKPKAKPKSKPTVKCRNASVKKRGKCVKQPRRKARKSTHANGRGK